MRRASPFRIGHVIVIVQPVLFDSRGQITKIGFYFTDFGTSLSVQEIRDSDRGSWLGSAIIC